MAGLNRNARQVYSGIGGRFQQEYLVLSDQVKSLDWKARKATIIEKAADSVISEIQEKLILLIK